MGNPSEYNENVSDSGSLELDLTFLLAYSNCLGLTAAYSGRL